MRRPPPPPQVPTGGEPTTAKGGEPSEPAYLRRQEPAFLRPTGERAPLLSGSSPDEIIEKGEMAPSSDWPYFPYVDAFCGIATVFLADYHLDGVADGLKLDDNGGLFMK